MLTRSARHPWLRHTENRRLAAVALHLCDTLILAAPPDKALYEVGMHQQQCTTDKPDGMLGLSQMPCTLHLRQQ